MAGNQHQVMNDIRIAAVIFNSAKPTGGDVDLGTPNKDFGGPGIGIGGQKGATYQNDTPMGNVLIVAENLIDKNNDKLVDDPDDADLPGMELNFDFTMVKQGTVTVSGITLIDYQQEENEKASIDLMDASKKLLVSIKLPNVGDNGVGHFVFGPYKGVAYMKVNLQGSGAIDNIFFTPDRKGSVSKPFISLFLIPSTNTINKTVERA